MSASNSIKSKNSPMRSVSPNYSNSYKFVSNPSNKPKLSDLSQNQKMMLGQRTTKSGNFRPIISNSQSVATNRADLTKLTRQ